MEAGQGSREQPRHREEPEPGAARDEPGPELERSRGSSQPIPAPSG